MDSKPDTIKISSSSRQEILADQADLFLSVRGSSVIGGDQAMKKAREVSLLVEELNRAGIPAENIHLQGMHVETASGGILKSSSAIYRLRLRCDKLEQIPELLDIIGSQKNTTLERIEWKYPEEQAREQGLEAALAKTKAKAEKVAAALGVRLLGVYDFMENIYDEEQPAMPFMAQAAMMKRGERAASDEPSLGIDIQHGKSIHVGVEVWYRVSEFGTGK